MGKDDGKKLQGAHARYSIKFEQRSPRKRYAVVLASQSTHCFLCKLTRPPYPVTVHVMYTNVIYRLGRSCIASAYLVRQDIPSERCMQWACVF